MENLLGLEDQDYWNKPTRTVRSVFETLESEQLNGIRIGAPSAVALDSRMTLPIVAYRAGTYFDLRSLEFAKHAVLVAVDLTRNTVRVADAIEVEDPMGSSPPAAPVPKGYTAVPYVIDVRQRLALAWEPGSYLFSIIMRDRISNRVKVSLGKSHHGFRDEAVEEFIAAYRRRQARGPVSPPEGDPLPRYRRLPQSPQIPSKNGIALKLERVLLLDRDTKWILHGAFRLPALPQEVIPPPEVRNPDAPPTPTAIIRIAIFATGADTGRWALLPLRVPSYDLIPSGKENPVFTGFFSFDLMHEGRQLAASPQTYFFYALSGEVLEGPVASALVPESWVHAGY